MLETLLNTLISQENKSTEIKFKTDGKRFMVYVANSLRYTLCEDEWKLFYPMWKGRLY